MINKLRTFYKHHPWTTRLLAGLLVVVLVLGLLRVALSPSISYTAKSWLKHNGIDANIEDVSISITGGTVSLINATGSRDGNPLFNIGLIDIHWEWRPLQKKSVVVTKVELDSLDVDIEQSTDTIVISGISFPLGQVTEEIREQADSDEKAIPWSASLGEVSFSNLNVCYVQHNSLQLEANSENRVMDYCVNLEKLSWGGNISYGTDRQLLQSGDLPLTSTGDFTLNGLTVTDNLVKRNLLTSSANLLSNVEITGLNNITIDKIEMNDLSALQRDDLKHQDAVRYEQLIVNELKLENMNKLTIRDIDISKPGLYMVKETADNWEFQQWLPGDKTNKQPDNNTKTDQPGSSVSSFKVTINDINVSEPDFCYLDKPSSLYYCLVLDQLSWNGNILYDTAPAKTGDINLSASGNLALSHTNIRNHTINRNLLDMQSLAINELKVTGIDRISFDKLTVDTLSVLQRGDKAEDNTAAFNNLTVNKLDYHRDGIVIDTASLDGLASMVSKNSDGEWEHDKWLTKTADNKDEDKPAESSGQPTKETFAIAINSLTLNSDSLIQFLDQSTTPETLIGLKQLEFSIDKLYSDKPSSNSNIKLFAKSTRHATIDLNGTIKPFADKLSMDAKGKLKGFDLRAGSPQTKKAIGHTIQSGQLDADLTILAKDGILDSNIGLSLYHFKIKPVNKEAASELDKKFGMPLNRTLVLLRDKDDSIHLDIPVTGDVNKPNFNPMDAIIKATTKAATTTLITFYTPYGLAYVGGNLLLDLATALNFDPVIFQPGSSELQNDGKQNLEKTSKLMTEKPGIRMTLCGLSNTQDALTLYPELKKQQQGKDTEKIKLTKEQVASLHKLAGERQENSKNYLVEQLGIDHSRLILCEPEYRDDDDAISGVEINI